MNSRRSLARGVLALSVLLGVTSSASAVPVVIDAFDTAGNKGRFGVDPDASSQNRGLSETADGQGPSNTAQTTEFFQAGNGSLQLNLTPGTSIPAATTPGFLLRLQSGGSTAANNMQLNPDGDTDPTGYVGAFLRTLTPNIEVAFAFDDGPGLELSTYQPLPNDGQFHLLQVNLDDADQFNAFAGTSNGTIDQSALTLDSIFIRSTSEQTEPIVLHLDTVAFNTDGDLSALVPEPSALGLAGFAGLAMLARCRRAA
jgi:hypothetical protein